MPGRALISAAGVLAMTALSVGGACPNAGAVTVAPDPQRIDRYVRSALSAARLPGMALAITRGSSIVHLKGYGTDGRGGPVTPDTQFMVASLSKSFTAFTVMRLVDTGRVTLDAPVRRYLPGFRTADPAGERITVRQLLNQTSGLSDPGFPGLAHDTSTRLHQRVARLRRAHLAGIPGREFRYTNLNYEVLGRLIEVVSGRSLSEQLREQVFGPLGMTATVEVTRAQDGPRAAARLARGAVLAYGVPVRRPEQPGLVGGSSGVISTARDMAAWLVTQQGDGRFRGRRLVSADAMRTMHTPPGGVAGDYAMGWFAGSPPDGPRRLEHNGVLSTFYADQVILPDHRIGLALLYDAHHALAATDGIKEGLIALMTGRPPPSGRFPDGRMTAVLLGALTLGTVLLRARALARIRQWSDRAGRRGRARALPAIVWPVVPAVVVPAMPWLLRVSIDRSFSLTQIFLSMPDVMAWLAAAGVLGVLLSGARIAVLLRPARTPPQSADVVHRDA